MPELPEVETVKNTLKNLILHKQIRDIDVFYDRMIRNVSIEDFKKNYINKSIIDIKRYGKYLIFLFEDIALISHLRMEGKYFIKNTDDPKNKHEHVIFYFTDGSTLRYHDTRKFGTFDVCELEDIYSNSPISKLGYEPFEKEVTISYLRNKLQKKSIAIKSSLLDQSILTGLGNIYVDEVLFSSKIHPEKPSNTLKTKNIKDIIKYSQEVLNKAINLGGTTIRSYTSSLGVTGLFQNELLVHMRKDEDCLVCGTRIEKIKVNGRGTYYCPSCQKK